MFEIDFIMSRHIYSTGTLIVIMFDYIANVSMHLPKVKSFDDVI